MRSFCFLSAAALLLAFTSPAPAGKFNKVLSIGDVAPAWEGLEGTDGTKHALADLKGKDVVVVVFTCNSCPVAEGTRTELSPSPPSMPGLMPRWGWLRST